MRVGAILVSAALALGSTSSAQAWGPATHQKVANGILNHWTIQPFLLDAATVASWADDLDYPPWQDVYHHPNWENVAYRQWLTDPKWNDLDDETKRIAFFTHQAADTTVPVGGHYPASVVWSDWFVQNLLEARAEVYTNVYSTPYNCYTGAYSQQVDQLYNDVIANATWFEAHHSSGDYPTAGCEGLIQAQRIGQAMIFQYLMTKEPTVAAANGSYSAGPGQFVQFSSAGSQDPDSYTVTSTNGDWVNNGGGLSNILWDLDSDGQYDDASGAGPTLSYESLIGLGLATGQWLTIGLKVVDDEGTEGVDTALLALYPSILGDANIDGAVDPADYTVWADNYGPNSGWTNGDFNMDDAVDPADYTIWADNYGAVASSGGEGWLLTSSIPEPGALCLLALGAGFLLIARRRR